MLNLKEIEEKLTADPSWSQHFVEIEPSAEVEIQLVYATPNNFLNENLYHDFNRAWLHRQAATKLEKVTQQLKRAGSAHKILIYDSLRPWRFQVKMFSKVEGGPLESYVANPARGSLHNYGLAIDLSLKAADGKIVDMGSDFDEFAEVSQPQLEEQLLASGQLTQRQLDHRKYLRGLMENAGFFAIPNEWWHFNSCSLEEAKKISIRID